MKKRKRRKERMKREIEEIKGKMSTKPYNICMSCLTNDEQFMLIDTFKKENENWFQRAVELQNDASIYKFMETLDNWTFICCDVACVDHAVEYVLVVCITQKEEDVPKTVMTTDGNELKIYYHINEEHQTHNRWDCSIGWEDY